MRTKHRVNRVLPNKEATSHHLITLTTRVRKPTIQIATWHSCRRNWTREIITSSHKIMIKWGSWKSSFSIINLLFFQNWIFDFIFIIISNTREWALRRKISLNSHSLHCHSLLLSYESVIREIRREKERESASMAASQFSASCSRTGSFSQYDSGSRFIDFKCRSSKSKLFFIRTLNPRPLRRSFSVKSVSSEPTQKLKDPIADEGPDRLLPYLSSENYDSFFNFQFWNALNSFPDFWVQVLRFWSLRCELLMSVI